MKRRRFLLHAALSGLAVIQPVTGARAATPAVGGIAPDLALNTLEGMPVRLHGLSARAPVALIFLRGYPGYQCPLCDRQVGELVAKAEAIRSAGGQVLLIYAGSAERARELLKGKALPGHFTLAFDPALSAADTYGLRWNARNETVYPSTFVLDRQARIRYARISREHGGRAPAAEVIRALAGAR